MPMVTGANLCNPHPVAMNIVKAISNFFIVICFAGMMAKRVLRFNTHQ